MEQSDKGVVAYFSIVESVKRRMEETFAASGSQGISAQCLLLVCYSHISVVHRMKVRQDANIKLAQAVDEFGGNPSDIGPPTGCKSLFWRWVRLVRPLPVYSSTRKADKKGKKKKQSSDED